MKSQNEALFEKEPATLIDYEHSVFARKPSAALNPSLSFDCMHMLYRRALVSIATCICGHTQAQKYHPHLGSKPIEIVVQARNSGDYVSACETPASFVLDTGSILARATLDTPPPLINSSLPHRPKTHLETRPSSPTMYSQTLPSFSPPSSTTQTLPEYSQYQFTTFNLSPHCNAPRIHTIPLPTVDGAGTSWASAPTTPPPPYTLHDEHSQPLTNGEPNARCRIPDMTELTIRLLQFIEIYRIERPREGR